ncbi:MAG: hypothetical protein [Circular genetic element sp.]|nr:MAG: hypothetical protein [Circular genetic element sp.]
MIMPETPRNTHETKTNDETSRSISIDYPILPYIYLLPFPPPPYLTFNLPVLSYLFNPSVSIIISMGCGQGGISPRGCGTPPYY